MQVTPQVRRWITGPGADPSVRLRYWTEVEGRPRNDPRARRARRSIGREGWAAAFLRRQFPDGHWTTPGNSDQELYRPKYVVTFWRAILLAELGVTRAHPRVRRTAELILRRWTETGTDLLGGPESEVCVTGNATRALILWGYLGHPVVGRSIDWIVRTQRLDGGWHCFRSRSGSLDCWEGLAALAEIPEGARTEAVRNAIVRGAGFYLDRRLMDEDRVRYPPWFRIHYPNHYYYDVLVGLRILTKLGYGADRRLAPALRWLERKCRSDGTWALDADHPDLDPVHGGYVFDEGPVWPTRLEAIDEPSRLATVEALAVLSRVERARRDGRSGPTPRAPTGPERAVPGA